MNLAHGSGFGVLKWIMRLVDWNILSVEKAAGIVQNLSSSIREDLEAKGVETGINMVKNSLDEPPSLYALAMGNKNGQTASCGTTFRASDLISMGEATGIPLACGLKLLVDGKITKSGVFAPEGAIDPKDFFKELDAISNLFEENSEIAAGSSKFINIYKSWS
tara:strand:+ start:40 stop:528 length:489 start_codon:yes stop_codon:yes gene_type:complete